MSKSRHTETQMIGALKQLEAGRKAHINKNLTPQLPKAPQPPLAHAGAVPDSDRAKRPPLAEPAATDQELKPGDHVESLGNFGKPTGELGTVEQANDDDAVVKWDGDGRMRTSSTVAQKGLAARRPSRSARSVANASFRLGLTWAQQREQN